MGHLGRVEEVTRPANRVIAVSFAARTPSTGRSDVGLNSTTPGRTPGVPLCLYVCSLVKGGSEATSIMLMPVAWVLANVSRTATIGRS